MIVRPLISLILIAFVLTTFLPGCNNTKIVEKGNSVVPKATIPPIDASGPTETETATLALG